MSSVWIYRCPSRFLSGEYIFVFFKRVIKSESAAVDKNLTQSDNVSALISELTFCLLLTMLHSPDILNVNLLQMLNANTSTSQLAAGRFLFIWPGQH